MGVSGYGSFFCLWAVCARSARGRVFTEPWATPPTAGAMKIERGVVYNPTIHHGYLLENDEGRRDGSSKAREGASTARDSAPATRRRGTARRYGDGRRDGTKATRRQGTARRYGYGNAVR